MDAIDRTAADWALRLEQAGTWNIPICELALEVLIWLNLVLMVFNLILVGKSEN